MMGYRGHDLDLRTPQTWRAAADEPPQTGKSLNGPARGQGYSGEHEIPIWVDDTVLACCNHAFDVALAHRSGEVRVEHLLHALTRIEDAADILDSHGIRAASLRRETATAIASEMPVTLTNGSSSPRRADAFEEILRLAAAHAYQRNQPVNVEDLLYVFLEMRPAIPGIELVERHLVNVRRERPERPQAVLRRRSPPSYAPPSFPPFEPRGYDMGDYEPRERVRRTPGRFFAPEPASRPVRTEMPLPESVQAATDHLQNSRLDALEQMVRAISGQIAGQRDEASRFSGGLFDRLQSLETLVSNRPEGGGIAGVELLLQRLDEVEQSVRAAGPREFDLTPVIERLAALETKIEAHPQVVSGEVDLSSLLHRLEELERHVGEKLNESVGGLLQRFVAIEQNAQLGDVLGRLGQIEQALLGRDGLGTGDIDARVGDLAEAVSLQQATLDDVRSMVSADVREVNLAINEQSTNLARTSESLSELVRAVESLRDEERNTVAQVSHLVGGYRAEVENFIVQANDNASNHNSALKEVHDALMKLNANQHTLAGSIDQWRSDGAGDLAVVAARIEGLEEKAGRPMALLENLSASMENMHRLTVERYHRRNRFWYWLFGTDDWVAASWPSQSQRIEAERAALRQIQS
ncbi:MAG: hypothetical protein KDJ47_10415 [Hyphomicrobiaceae bacterium]|nr:hypothetical protein [Hyphomicrobiaceae bacterium]